MAQAERDTDPLLKPRLVKALKNRPRVVDMGMRSQVLEEVENNICERRCADNVADRLTTSTVRSVLDVTQPVVRNKAREGLEAANKGTLRRL